MIFTPNKGRLVSTKGKIAQCIAHASEVAIPKPSQFILKFMEDKDRIFAIMLQVLTSYPGYNFIPSLFGCKFATIMLKKKNIWWVYILFFALLLGAFYLALFNEPNFHDSKLAVINPNIPDFHFVNQDGKTVSQKNTEDKVYVTEYFFTTCKGICPLMNANMRRIYDHFKDEREFMIISHTCMPETDS